LREAKKVELAHFRDIAGKQGARERIRQKEMQTECTIRSETAKGKAVKCGGGGAKVQKAPRNKHVNIRAESAEGQMSEPPRIGTRL
jgi:hypothetical protein